MPRFYEKWNHRLRNRMPARVLFAIRFFLFYYYFYGNFEQLFIFIFIVWQRNAKVKIIEREKNAFSVKATGKLCFHRNEKAQKVQDKKRKNKRKSKGTIWSSKNCGEVSENMKTITFRQEGRRCIIGMTFVGKTSLNKWLQTCDVITFRNFFSRSFIAFSWK